MPAPAVSVQFSTVALDKTLVAGCSAEAVKLYNYILDNFETKTLSAMIARCCLEYGNVRKGVWMDWKISGYQLFRLCSSAGICKLEQTGLITVTLLLLRIGLTKVAW